MTPPSRKTLTMLGGLMVCLGGGRLVINEVQLASETARVHGLELKAAEADRDRRRVIRLENSQRAEALATVLRDTDLAATREQVTALEGQVTTLEGELVASVQAAQADGLAATKATERLNAEHARARGTLEAKLDASNAEAKARERELDAAKAMATRQAAKLTAAGALAREREEQRDTARSEAETARRAQGDAERRLSETATQLQKSETTAAERGRLLEVVRAAGVNVARLSGERPMPRISAVIVHVDTEATPMEVLVDAGEASGLELGDRLYVLRGQREVACLEVIAVHPDVSATRLVRGNRQLRLRPGDDITSTPSKSP